MFTLIRGVIIVGLIFYFSPVRDQGEPKHQIDRGEREPASAAPPFAQGLWNWISGSFAEEVVRTAVNDKAQEAGLRLKDQVAWSLPEAAARAASAALPAPERDTSGRNGPGASVRCVYRCDGTE